MNKKILLYLSLIGVFCSFVCPHVYAEGKVVPIFYKNIDAVSISAEQAEDPGTKFLVWLFSPNYGNRYSDYEEAIEESEVTVTVSDVTFSDGTTSSFTDGAIFDYDVILEIDGSESFADVSYISLENDGQYHINGQITVLDNQITGLYISR